MSLAWVFPGPDRDIRDYCPRPRLTMRWRRPTAHHELDLFMDTAERLGCFPRPCWNTYSDRNGEAWLRLISDDGRQILAQIKVVRPSSLWRSSPCTGRGDRPDRITPPGA